MTKPIPIEFPKDTQEGTQSFLSKWFKKVGDHVSLHEPIAEVSTDKVIMEIASPGEGIITELLVSESAEIKPGDVLGSITPGAEGASKAAPSQKAPELTPAVKKLLKDNNIDASAIIGTGRGGRITPEDVEKHIAAAKGGVSSIQSTKVPHTPMRKMIAKNLSDSLLKVAPHVTTVFECDLSAVLAHKAKMSADGIPLTLTAYFVHAIAKGVQAVPEANSRWHDDALEIYSEVNVGVGTATKDGGLIVPVIKGVEKLSLKELGDKINSIVARARENDLAREDITDGTITISNHGMSGSLFATPIIIHQPQSAIMGIGKVEKRAKVITKDGKDIIEIRPCAFATLTIDHRVMDGFKANAFMTTFVQTLEELV